MGQVSKLGVIESQSLPPDRPPRLAIVSLFALLFLAAVLRWSIAGESLWLDELHSAWAGSGPWSATSERAALGNQGPLYFYGLQVWGSAFGESTRSLRTPSILAGLALLAAVYIVLYRWTKNAWAPMACVALAAIDGRLLFYSTEVRPYAWVQFLSFAHLALLCSILQHPSWGKRVVWVVAGAGVVHLHYTAGLLLVVEFALVAIVLARRDYWLTPTTGETSCYGWRDFFLDGSVCAALLAPAAWQVWDIGSRRGMWTNMTRSLDLRVLWRELRGNEYLLLSGVGLALQAIRAPGLTANKTGAPRIGWLAIALLAFLPPVLAWCATATGAAPLYFPRYYVLSFVGPIALAGLVAARYRSHAAQASLAAALLLVAAYPFATAWLKTGRVLSDRREDWRAAVQWLEEQGRPQRPVILHSGLLEADEMLSRGEAGEEYCLFPLASVYQPPQTHLHAVHVKLGSSPTALQALRESRSSGGAYLLIRGRKKTADQIAARLARDLGSQEPPPRRVGSPALGLYEVEFPR